MTKQNPPHLLRKGGLESVYGIHIQSSRVVLNLPNILGDNVFFTSGYIGITGVLSIFYYFKRITVYITTNRTEMKNQEMLRGVFPQSGKIDHIYSYPQSYIAHRVHER